MDFKDCLKKTLTEDDIPAMQANIEKVTGHRCYVVFDVEATGLESTNDIIQLSSMWLDEYLDVKSVFDKYSSTKIAIIDELEKLLQLNNKMVDAKSGGKNFTVVGREWVDWIQHNLTREGKSFDDILFVTHNAKFDTAMVSANLRKCGISGVSFTPSNMFCTMADLSHFYKTVPYKPLVLDSKSSRLQNPIYRGMLDSFRRTHISKSGALSDKIILSSLIMNNWQYTKLADATRFMLKIDGLCTEELFDCFVTEMQDRFDSDYSTCNFHNSMFDTYCCAYLFIKYMQFSLTNVGVVNS